MEGKVNNWINNFHLVLLLLPAIPVFLDVHNQLWPAFTTIGLLVLVQCFHYVSTMNAGELEGKDVHIHLLCIASKILLATTYIIITGYWFFSPLYYVLINPRNRREEIIAFLLPILGVLVAWLPKLVTIHELPWVLLSAIVVCFLTILLHIVEGIVKRILIREHMLTEQMTITAINELRVKNLNRELAMKYQLADLNARLEERENIARNIHNVVGHTITSAIVSLQAFRILQHEEPIKAEDKLSAASERMRLALEEIRRAVRVLDQETPVISLKDFQRLIITELHRFSMDTEIEVSHNLDHFILDTEIEVSHNLNHFNMDQEIKVSHNMDHFNLDQETEVSHNLDHFDLNQKIEVSHNLDHINLNQQIDKRYCEFLHSSLTECLNNGIRHGKASSFFVFMQCDTNRIELSVTDNGTGFERLSKEEQDRRISQGYGIRKMEKFVLEHGGNMKLSTDNGFRVQLELPLIQV